MLRWDVSRALDAIALGRIAVDLNPVDYNCSLGESTTFKKYVGGSPANIAVGLARLGEKAGFFATVSQDALGDYVKGYFEKEGIDTSHVFRCAHGERLGLAFTEIRGQGQSSLLMYREKAADLQLRPSHIDETYLAMAKLLLVSGTALSHSPSREAALKAIALAKKTNTPVALDFDYRAYSWADEEETALYMALAAEKADILLGSREEFDRAELHLDLDGSDRASRAHWMACGAQLVVIKHGAEGSTAFAGEKAYRVRPFRVTMLKGFGGGDGYASALLHGMLRDWPLAEALAFASASAALVVASHACSEAMPSEADIRRFLEARDPASGPAVTEEQEGKGRDECRR